MTARPEPHELAATAPAVRIVPNDRMADRGEMYSDLVCAPGKQVRPQQVPGVEAREPREVRPRRPSATDDCHALSVSRISSDRPIDRDPLVSQVSPAQD